MTRENLSAGTPVQPKLADLMASYLERQMSAQAAGLASPEPVGEVVPFEATPVQPVDPQVAWKEAVVATRSFQGGADTGSWQAPPEWPMLVSSQEPAAALAFCTGNYPQLVRNLLPLLQAANVARLRPEPGKPLPAPALTAWADKSAQKAQFPQMLLVIGALRLARQFEAAARLIEKHRSSAPAEWRAAWANEEAALAWHQGNAEEAAALWNSQPESVAVWFNRGMAALFLGRPAEARTWLGKAVAELPEAGAWHHLGRLYLTLAEMR
jgi:tetratricopeptide (TPR) repeat protein